jgi:protease-4
MKRWPLILAVLALALAAAGCFSHNNLSLFPENEDRLSTRLVKAPADDGVKDRILLLDIEGVIVEWETSSWFGLNEKEPTTAEVRRKLEKAATDSRIKAVVLRVNSPGGTVTATDIVYREIKKYKARTKAPVVASFMGVAASGGYYVSCTADTIVSHPTTITGSIGVLMHSFGFDGLFKKIGMESRVIKAGRLKDVGNPFAEQTEEQKQVLQRLVDEAYGRFIAVVAEGRPNLKQEEILKLADGRVYSATDAKQLGLVDQLGDLDDAIEEAKRLAKIRDAGVILYSTSTRPEQNIYSTTRAEGPKINVDASLISYREIMEMSQPRLLYMWLGY